MAEKRWYPGDSVYFEGRITDLSGNYVNPDGGCFIQVENKDGTDVLSITAMSSTGSSGVYYYKWDSPSNIAAGKYVYTIIASGTWIDREKDEIRFYPW